MVIVETDFTVNFIDGRSIAVRLTGKEGQYRTAHFESYGIAIFKTNGALATIYTWNIIASVDIGEIK